MSQQKKQPNWTKKQKLTIYSNKIKNKGFLLKLGKKQGYTWKEESYNRNTVIIDKNLIF